ncbi:unnamed protein product [Periconia digitata]|uniref:Uncharacterized protein n=1 Tax=Periconia digitata TaxID=1303443 RepID=A0A9W4XGE0_9PLEO|nr:unnamed protein product [Periconia digitata]
MRASFLCSYVVLKCSCKDWPGAYIKTTTPLKTFFCNCLLSVQHFPISLLSVGNTLTSNPKKKTL